MEYDKLLTSLKRQRVAIAHAGQLPEGLIELQRYLSGRPEIWTYRFFRNGSELVGALEGETCIKKAEASHLLAVLPDDMGLEPGWVNPLATRSNLRVLIIVGKARRGKEDRRRVYYIGRS
ncbi:MAG: hypothetical protein ACE5IO_03840 [Thermoplasmata archaeon]